MFYNDANLRLPTSPEAYIDAEILAATSALRQDTSMKTDDPDS